MKQTRTKKKSTKKTAKKKPLSLRKRAESLPGRQKESLRELSAQDLKKLVHELGTHQIELEMQNEELRLAHTELESSRRKYADLYDFSPNGYFTFDKNGLILEVNDTGAGMLGLQKRSLIAKPFLIYVEPESRTIFISHIAEVFRSQIRQTCEVIIRTKKSVLIPVQLQSIVADSGAGIMVSCRTAVNDISELKHVEGSLEESIQREHDLVKELAEILDAIPTPVVIVHDPDSTHMTGNRAADELLKHSRGAEASLSAPPETRPRHFRAMKNDRELRIEELPAQRAARGEYVRDFEFNLVFDDDSIRSLLGYGTPLLDNQDRPRGAVHVLVDITERKQAEVALRTSEERLRLFIEHAPASLAMFDREMRYVSVSRRWMSDYGLGERDLHGLSHYDVFPDIPERWKEIHRRALSGEVVRDESDRFMRADGSVQWLRWEVRPWYDTTEAVAGIVIFTEDITERKRMEEALSESEERYRSLVDHSPDAVIVIQDGRFAFVNPAGLLLHGAKSLDQLIGQPVKDFLHPDDFEKVTRGIAVAVDGRLSPLQDVRVRRLDDTYVWTEGSGVRVEYGGKPAVQVIIRDITELRKHQEELLMSRMDMERAQEVGSIGSWRLDVRRNVLTWSDENHRIFGIPKGTPLTYETFLSAVHPDDRAYVDTRWNAGLRGEPYDIEHRLLTDGVVKWVREKAYLEFDQQGELIGGFGITQEITERKKAENALRSAHKELEHRAIELNAVNKELESFAYTVSHDLKTPLRSIEGFTQAIMEDYSEKLDDRGKDYMRRVTSACQKMNQLIDAILNLSRLTKNELHENIVDMSSLAQVITHNLRKQEALRHADFIIAEKVKAKGDIAMLEVVLQNLLDNAWKFTSKHPTATIEFGTIESDGKTVYFVRDNGIGFDMQYAKKLFMPFRRLHTESEFPGLGIGLAIANRIIIRHGGRMWAESEPEKGAIFYFTL